MQAEKVSILCAKYKGEMTPDDAETFVRRLSDAGEEAYYALDGVSLKDKKTAFLLSVFLGGWAVGRFYLGDIKGGLFKLILTILLDGVCGFLAAVLSPWILFVAFAIVSAWWALDVLQVKSKTVAVNTALLFDTVYATYLEPNAFFWISRGRKRTMGSDGVVFSIEGANGCAIAGFFLSFLGGLPGLVLSVIGYVMAKRNEEKSVLAVTGIVMSCVWFFIVAVAIAVALLSAL